MSAQKAQVMLVDDHAMLRHGMAMLIDAEPDMQVIAEASDSVETLAFLKKNSDVDIILVDISLKTISGLEVIKSIHLLKPELPVLVVSMHDESVYAERALHAGARGYVMKQEPGENLIIAIREVLNGNVFLSKAMQMKLLNRVASGNNKPEIAINSLTPSEFEVLHLIGKGNNTQEIAKLLNRSIKTIETHRFNIRTKLNLKDSADLIRYATRWVLEEQ
ncbi:MAG: response regulator transcription factor [Nitrosomonas sp.]|nr:MAG: response regulator transcription factor [Nitrosomonas sp.]